MGRATGVNLTKAIVESLESRENLYRVPDAQTRGLEIQIMPSGVRSWVIRYRLHGHGKSHTLGRWPELTVAQARNEAAALLGRIRNGENPSATRKNERKAETVSELAARFQTEHLDLNLKPSTKKEYENLIKRRILPNLGSERVKDIQPADVARMLSKIRSETPKGIEANRTRAVLSKMFSFAELWGLRPGGSNPARGQARAPETKKARHLSDKELVALGAALRHLEPTPQGQERPEGALSAEDPFALAAFRLYLLTGMRKSELIGDKQYEIPALPWSAVDLEADTIRLDHHKTAKKVGARLIPLCAAASELLDSLPEVLGCPYVIPGAKAGEALVNLQVMWVRVRAAVSKLQEKAEVPKKERLDLSNVTIHDLRRSYSSLGARMGYPNSFTGTLLGHSAATVTEGYARLGTDPLREAAERIGARMAALLDGSVDLVAEAKEAKDAKTKAKATEPKHA